MRILCVDGGWVGNLMSYLMKGLQEKGDTVKMFKYKERTSMLKKLHLNQLTRVKTLIHENYIKVHNDEFIKTALEYKPELIFIYNESKILPTSIIKIKQELGCKFACYLADNPFSSASAKNLSYSLPRFDIIFYGDRIWKQNIQNVAPDSKLFFSVDGYDKDLFYPIDQSTITDEDIRKYSCDISFTGSGYGGRAEGAYRSGIIRHLKEYNIKIYGNGGWDKIARYFPEINDFFSGDRLNFEDLKKLYTLSKINLNIPNPQVFTAFQSRIFELAACKAFQIIDYRPELSNYFSDDEMVTFKNIDELKEKVNHYLSHEDERKKIVEKLHNKVVDLFSWTDRAEWIQKVIYENC